MRVRLLVAAAALLTLAACGESPTAPKPVQPGTRSNDIVCRGGYIIATNADGTQSCVPDPNPPAGTAAAP